MDLQLTSPRAQSEPILLSFSFHRDPQSLSLTTRGHRTKSPVDLLLQWGSQLYRQTNHDCLPETAQQLLTNVQSWEYSTSPSYFLSGRSFWTLTTRNYTLSRCDLDTNRMQRAKFQKAREMFLTLKMHLNTPSLLQSIPAHKESLMLINLLVSLLSEYIKPEAFAGQSIIFFVLKNYVHPLLCLCFNEMQVIHFKNHLKTK